MSITCIIGIADGTVRNLQQPAHTTHSIFPNDEAAEWPLIVVSKLIWYGERAEVKGATIRGMQGIRDAA